jgi:hypothetical protein
VPREGFGVQDLEAAQREGFRKEPLVCSERRGRHRERLEGRVLPGVVFPPEPEPLPPGQLRGRAGGHEHDAPAELGQRALGRLERRGGHGGRRLDERVEREGLVFVGIVEVRLPLCAKVSTRRRGSGGEGKGMRLGKG